MKNELSETFFSNSDWSVKSGLKENETAEIPNYRPSMSNFFSKVYENFLNDQFNDFQRGFYSSSNLPWEVAIAYSKL